MKKIKQLPLYQLVKQEIHNYIVSSGIKPGELIHPEGKLAELFGVSRGTLREAMRVLEEEGVILRRRGVGTVVCGGISMIRSTLDVNEGVTEMIRGKGLTPGSREDRVDEIPADKKLAEKLKLRAGDPVISLTRVRTANTLPVTYTIDYLPKWLAPANLIQRIEEGSLYAYLEDELGVYPDQQHVADQAAQSSCQDCLVSRHWSGYPADVLGANRFQHRRCAGRVLGGVLRGRPV